jgi:hypothetical protein
MEISAEIYCAKILGKNRYVKAQRSIRKTFHPKRKISISRLLLNPPLRLKRYFINRALNIN